MNELCSYCCSPFPSRCGDGPYHNYENCIEYLKKRLEAAENAVLSAKHCEGIDFKIAYQIWKKVAGKE